MAYDLSQVATDQNGMVITGAGGQTVNPANLSDAGYTAAVNYKSSLPAAPVKPVTMLSTDSGQQTLQKATTTLNTISPTTAPGYTPPTTAPVDTSAAVPAVPKAYFVNDAGQEAEYTQAQLDDPATQSFLTGGGYVQTKTEGPSLQQGGVDSTDSAISDAVAKFNSYNVDADPTFQGQSDQIKAMYTDLINQMTEYNTSRAKTFTALGFRSGATRYAGAVQAGIAGEELNQANDRIAKLVNDEANAVTQARTAYQNGQYALYKQQVDLLSSIRTQKVSALQDYQKTLSDATTKFNDTVVQASRDTAIANLVQQGVTDPDDILKALNTDANGDSTGSAFTAQEVSDALKLISPNDDLTKLSGATRDFFILKGSNQLPASVAALPEDQQMLAYLKQVKDASTIGAQGSKVTLTYAKSNNLPISTVGMSQEDLVNSLQSETPPAWFIEKASQQAQMSIDPNSEALKTAWDTYREQVTNQLEGGDTSTADTSSDATSTADDTNVY